MVSDDEVRRIELELREAGWAAHTGLERELSDWIRLASEVGHYPATVDDYTNDLCARDYLDEFARRASSLLQDAIKERTAAADQLFRTSTVEDVEGLLGLYFRTDHKDGWWWRRRPSSGSLADYLSASH